MPARAVEKAGARAKAGQAGRRSFRTRSVAASYPTSTTTTARSLLPTWSSSGLDQMAAPHCQQAPLQAAAGGSQQAGMLSTHAAVNSIPLPYPVVPSSATSTLQAHMQLPLASALLLSASADLPAAQQRPPSASCLHAASLQLQPLPGQLAPHACSAQQLQCSASTVLPDHAFSGTACARMQLSPASVIAPTDISWGSTLLSGDGSFRLISQAADSHHAMLGYEAGQVRGSGDSSSAYRMQHDKSQEAGDEMQPCSSGMGGNR